MNRTNTIPIRRRENLSIPETPHNSFMNSSLSFLEKRDKIEQLLNQTTKRLKETTVEPNKENSV